MRTVLGVVIAFVAMATLVFAASVAPWFVLGLDTVLQPGRFDTVAAFNVYAVLVGILGAIFAGWLCARIARSWPAVILLAVLCFIAGMTNAFGQSRKPEPGVRQQGLTVGQAVAARREPAWFTLLMPGVGVVGVLLGGRLGRIPETVAEYVTTSHIHADREAVWKILTDSAGYADWNPEIIGIDGRMALLERIKARVKVGGGAIRSVTMRVTAFQAPSRMEWTGGLPLGLFVGLRTFTLTPGDGAVEFRLHLRMSGPLAPLILESVGNRQPEIDSFSAALRARVEQQAGATTAT